MVNSALNLRDALALETMSSVATDRNTLDLRTTNMDGLQGVRDPQELQRALFAEVKKILPALPAEWPSASEDQRKQAIDAYKKLYNLDSNTPVTLDIATTVNSKPETNPVTTLSFEQGGPKGRVQKFGVELTPGTDIDLTNRLVQVKNNAISAAERMKDFWSRNELAVSQWGDKSTFGFGQPIISDAQLESIKAQFAAAMFPRLGDAGRQELGLQSSAQRDPQGNLTLVLRDKSGRLIGNASYVHTSTSDESVVELNVLGSATPNRKSLGTEI